MPTTNTNFSTLITAIDTKAQSLAASTTDPKDLVFLGKAVEALNLASTVSDVIAEGDTQIAAVQAEGTTQIAAVSAQGANYAPLAGATFTGAVSGTDLTLSGNLTVNGTQTVLNTSTLTVDDLNITIADGAADAAAANGAGITVDGASANITYTSATDTWDFNKAITGTYTNLHPELTTTSAATSQTIDMTKPMHHVTMTAGTAFSGVSIAAGRTAMMVLDTSATPHTPTWSADIKWPDATEPTWADYRYWIVSMTCLNGTTILASASGYTV